MVGSSLLPTEQVGSQGKQNPYWDLKPSNKGPKFPQWSIIVRNIPDINQILTGGQFWKRIEVFPVKETKFNKDFPPLIREKIEFNNHQNNLSSGQAPATPASTLCQLPASPLPASLPPTCQPGPGQPPAHPAWHQQACRQPPAHLLALQVPVGCQPPPGSQASPHSQSETLIYCGQSEKSLVAGEKFLTNSSPSEEGQIQDSDSTNYSGPSEEGKTQSSNFKNNSAPNQRD
ncbi:hypothetical protein DSO57_1000395 [Entomophthora muscae]|uniref:Uncharacterized protein n=1 Tax=Entomophthora muscae TaxID=34485 RepID=A0ACC2UI57_9FUNG|nr:hypothetical protein DSO57_1000395 [Entomophthora muscae]